MSQFLGRRVNTGKALQNDYYFNNAPGQAPGAPFDYAGRPVQFQYQSGFTPNAPSGMWNHQQIMANETSLRPFLDQNYNRVTVFHGDTLNNKLHGRDVYGNVGSSGFQINQGGPTSGSYDLTASGIRSGQIIEPPYVSPNQQSLHPSVANYDQSSSRRAQLAALRQMRNRQARGTDFQADRQVDVSAAGYDNSSYNY